MFHHILVAADGSQAAQRAVQEAIDIARTQQARLTILTVAPPVPSMMPVAGGDPSAVSETNEHWAGEVVRAALATVPDGVDVHTVIRIGHPTHEIVEELNQGDYDLIVVGSRGRGAARAGVLGSVNGAVHFHTHIPMLSISLPDEHPTA
jgi:nucleotide-binding universal stress UspA family protein